MNAEIKAAKKSMTRTAFNLWHAGYKSGRATGKAEGWLERQEEVWSKEKARHDKDGKFKAKGPTLVRLDVLDAYQLTFKGLTRRRKRS